MPERMEESEFIVIPKKEGAVECAKHRTTSIMSPAAKIILRVVHERLKSKIAETVDRAQCGRGWMEEVVELAGNRRVWHSIVANVT